MLVPSSAAVGKSTYVLLMQIGWGGRPLMLCAINYHPCPTHVLHSNPCSNSTARSK